ncbi:hypothetical protein [Streptomyces sp. NPDC088170]|uniref:hypothetical protein n=1 Tax=Streptomyces sp. NPDC088170 TaxID=3365834 RepID=UPI0037F85964
MLRVIRSTVHGLDVSDDQAEEFEEAIGKVLTARGEIRETYALDEIGQKFHQIALAAYTDPAGEHRWAILDTGPTEVDWQDTGDLDEAITAYEQWVRETTDCAGPSHDDEGNERPVWDYSDVAGVPAREQEDAEAGNVQARMVDAVRAHEAFPAAEALYQQAARRRQIAFARAIDAFGRGGQAALAGRVDLKEPTVKSLADRGRALL